MASFRIHTMEDDITFERVRHMPRRTRVCSMHRQLSWACQREIQMYEKENKVNTANIERSKTMLIGRSQELSSLKKKLISTKSDLLNRRASCPAVLSSGDRVKESKITHKDKYELNSPKLQDGAAEIVRKEKLHRSVTIHEEVSGNKYETRIEAGRRDVTTGTGGKRQATIQVEL